MSVLAGCAARRRARRMAVPCKGPATLRRARQRGQNVLVIRLRLFSLLPCNVRYAKTWIGYRTRSPPIPTSTALLPAMSALTTTWRSRPTGAPASGPTRATGNIPTCSPGRLGDFPEPEAPLSRNTLQLVDSVGYAVRTIWRQTVRAAHLNVFLRRDLRLTLVLQRGEPAC